MRLCLSAAGGGHLRQLLDLEPVWAGTDCAFVTESSGIATMLAERHRVHLVPHFALGQAKLGAPFRMVRLAICNLIRSAAIIYHERPDVVITTGSGSQVFTVLFARAAGAHIILIDSFARFAGPSMFARLAGPFAHIKIAQSATSAQKWRGSLVFDPFLILDTPRSPKDALLVATVGATLPFDRLISLVKQAQDKGLIPERIVAQTGVGGIRPDGLVAVETMPFDQMQDLLGRADLLVCHGGTGSLITGLRAGCRVIAVPRQFDLGEHYDDHQSEIVAAFGERGLIQAARDEMSFAEALKVARAATPVSATTNPIALLSFLREHLAKLGHLQNKKMGFRRRWRLRRSE